MLLSGKTLTPATKQAATRDNYTWYNGKGEHPRAGYVFDTKAAFAEQIYADYPEGVPVRVSVASVWKRGVGSVIGGDGFGWYGTPPKRFPHIGHVQIGHAVEIGDNVTINRGSVGDTIIGDDVKIDCGVHVGHNAVVGARSLLTAHCVIGGSAVIGTDVWVGLGAQIKNQVTVGDHAVIGMGAIVVKDVAAGTTVVGNPARVLS